MVSIQHARISHNPRRGYVIEDLDSITGTWVDEECIKGESRPIGVGTILRFGNTTFEVVASNRMQPWMQVVGAIAAGMLFFALLVFVGLALFSGNRDSPRLAPYGNQPITHGTEMVDALAVPPEFLRARGLHITDVSIKQVTDYDDDGVSEVWLDLDDHGEVVVTFGQSFDDWKVLGEFPGDCIVSSSSVVPGQNYFPTVQCPGTKWYKRQKREAPYELIEHEGAVVYYQPAKGLLKKLVEGAEPEPRPSPLGPRRRKSKGGKSKAEEPPPVVWDESKLKVGRFTPANGNDLAAFLTNRGITGPVHYLMCEDFRPELRAQALLAQGTVQTMGVGCIGQLRLEGIEGRPVAIALSKVGHEALIDDVITFFGGHPDGLFLPAKHRRLQESLETNPGHLQGGVKLVVDSQDLVTLFNPVPDIAEVLTQPARRLIEARGDKGAPRARSVTLTREGKFALSLPKCGDLEIKTHDFRSEGWESFFPFTFMEVWDKGCGSGTTRVLKVGYDAIGSGVHDANVGGIQLRAVVETTTSGRGVEVLRTRLTYRDPNEVVENSDEQLERETNGEAAP